MPVFNAADTLPRALRSLAAQTFQSWELVAIDDGSTDGSPELLRSAQSRDARIRLVSQSREGIVAALNRGLAEARGHYVARMDADDEATPDRLELQARHLDEASGLGLVGSQVEFVGDATKHAGYALYVEWLNQVVDEAGIERSRFIESPFAHPSVMFRRALVSQYGGYRQGDFPEDYELWLRWLEAGVRMAKVPRVLLRWHDSPRRLSRSDGRYSVDAFYRTKAVFLAREVRRRIGTRSLVVWGAGRTTRKRADLLSAQGMQFHAYIDIDPKKTNRSVAGIPVLTPAKLPPPSDAFVLGYVASRGARDLIRGHLLNHGYNEGADFLMCA